MTLKKQINLKLFHNILVLIRPCPPFLIELCSPPFSFHIITSIQMILFTRKAVLRQTLCLILHFANINRFVNSA